MCPLRCQKTYKRVLRPFGQLAEFDTAVTRCNRGSRYDEANRRESSSRERSAAGHLYSTEYRGNLDTTEKRIPTPEVPRRTSLVRNLRRPWTPLEHFLESTEKGKTEPPCAVTLAKCRRHRGTLSCAVRASEAEAQSHLSCVRMVTVPSLGGGPKGKNINYPAGS